MDIPSLPRASSSSSSTPARPRKRIARPGQWKRNEAKAKRARGEWYTSATTGKEIGAARQGPPCTCQRKCFEKFSADDEYSTVSGVLVRRTCKTHISTGSSGLGRLSGADHVLEEGVPEP